MQFTEHFRLAEFTKSATAKRLNIDNTAPAKVVEALRNLCVTVLEPLRQHYGKPVVIGSGYRCPLLNTAVKGVKNSQHMKGEAADLHLPSLEVGWMWFGFIRDNLTFDQLIMEHDSTGHYWIHVSCKTDSSKNRRQVIRNLLKSS